MITKNFEILNMDDVWKAIDEDISIGKREQRQTCSAIKRFCEICGVPLTNVLADPTAIRTLRHGASWQIAGITEKYWNNIVSRTVRALDHVGVNVDRRRRNTRLLDVWDALLDALDPEMRKRLRRFAGFCSARAIAPADVTTAAFDQFLTYLKTQSVQWNLLERWQEARRAWNKAVALPGSSYPSIPNTAPARWKSRPWGEFPESFRKEMLQWLDDLRYPGLDEDREPLRPRTIENYCGDIRRFCSRLVDNGLPMDRFGSLLDVLDRDLVRRGLALIQGDKTQEQARSSLHTTIQALLSISRYLQLDESDPGFAAQERQFEPIRRAARKVRNRQTRMVPKNLERINKLKDPTAGRLFRNLHLTVAARHKGEATPTMADAQEMQMAAVHALLLEAPLRISNVASLDLERHIMRPPGGLGGLWRIAIPGEEMKGHEPIETQLGLEGSAFLDEYLKRFRPFLVKTPSTILFANRKGGRKLGKALGAQYSQFIRRELGLEVNPHLLRHYAGCQWLEAMPGEYGGLSKLLGHRSVKTTAIYYTGAETVTAQGRWHEVLADLRAADRTKTVSSPPRVGRYRRGEAAE